MRFRIASFVALALAAGVAIVPASSAPLATGLQPLSDGDMGRISESGCNFSFDSSRKTLIFSINRSLMIRNGATPTICKFPDAQIGAFTDAKGAVTCGGRRLELRRTGKATSNMASDSASFPATLTVTLGRATQTIRGIAGTAC